MHYTTRDIPQNWTTDFRNQVWFLPKSIPSKDPCQTARCVFSVENVWNNLIKRAHKKIYATFFKVTLFGLTRDLFRAENVISIWGIKLGHFEEAGTWHESGNRLLLGYFPFPRSQIFWKRNMLGEIVTLAHEVTLGSEFWLQNVHPVSKWTKFRVPFYVTLKNNKMVPWNCWL